MFTRFLDFWCCSTYSNSFTKFLRNCQRWLALKRVWRWKEEVGGQREIPVGCNTVALAALLGACYGTRREKPRWRQLERKHCFMQLNFKIIMKFLAFSYCSKNVIFSCFLMAYSSKLWACFSFVFFTSFKNKIKKIKYRDWNHQFEDGWSLLRSHFQDVAEAAACSGSEYWS